MVFILQVWRDFQFQHLYNLAQRLMLETGCRQTVYLGALYFDPSLRNFGLSDRLIEAVIQVCLNSNTLAMTQSNFRGFDQFVENSFRKAKFVEALKYGDENLVLDGEKCFGLLSKLDGIRFYVDFGCCE